MATITLSADTLISSLMPSGGGSLASGDTIQLAGHSLIIDADAVDYPVTIANNGADVNLELRDLGRIKLNATLPATVHPYVDHEHPLPVSAAPGIDGDPYRTNLTANARAEIQIAENANFGLGGGSASLPTATRTGYFWAKVASADDSTHLTFDRDLPLHVGDYIQNISTYNKIQKVRVSAYDPTTMTATLDTPAENYSAGQVWHLLAGGVCVNKVATVARNNQWFTAPMTAGTLVCFSPFALNANNGVIFSDSGEVSVKRLLWGASYGTTGAGNAIIANMYPMAFDFGEVAGGLLLPATTGTAATATPCLATGRVGECALANIFWPLTRLAGHVKIGSGINVISTLMPALYGAGFLDASGVWFSNNIQAAEQSCVHLVNSDIAGINFANEFLLAGGTISRSGGVDYHAPATASDVTWRYTDRTVVPGATLRLRCAWQREGSAETRAIVAVTDMATWWPQLWPMGSEALASVEFTGGTADWRSELLTWRNTGTEAATVRVWECVTGTVGGGYLKVEEVKGGAL